MKDPHDPDNQDEVIGFLSRPDSYGLTSGSVERIDTHCSIVFLAASFAYKLKRAIRYADLDYMTRAARAKAAAAEIVLNRRTAPDLYLAVRAITREPDGSLAFEGRGPPLEHVVVMRRFAQDDLFESLAEKGHLIPEIMAALGETIADFHRGAAITPEHGGAVAIDRVIAGNARELGRHAPPLEQVMIDEVSADAEASLEWLATLIERRRTEGKVRHCHGDLRLANIVVDAGRPLLFDGIEFSDEIACIDVLYDLAFLLMDLLLRERGDLASIVFNAYLDRQHENGVGETEGLAQIPLFLSLRAATRCYGLAGSAERKQNPREAARILAAARRHLAAARAFLDPAPPQLIALAGLMQGDAGDARAHLIAALAGLIAPPPGARLLRLDSASSAEPIWQEAEAVLAAGYSVALESGFLAAADRSRLAGFARRVGVRFHGFWTGPLPPDLQSPPWQSVESGRSMLAVLAGLAAQPGEGGMANAASLVGSAGDRG